MLRPLQKIRVLVKGHANASLSEGTWTLYHESKCSLAAFSSIGLEQRLNIANPLVERMDGRTLVISSSPSSPAKPDFCSPDRRSSTCNRTIPEAWLLPRQLQQPHARQFVTAPRLVAVTRQRRRHHAARPPLAEGIVLPVCPIAAFSATSSSRFFGSPTAALLCPDSDPLPAFAVSCSHPAAAWRQRTEHSFAMFRDDIPGCAGSAAARSTIKKVQTVLFFVPDGCYRFPQCQSISDRES